MDYLQTHGGPTKYGGIATSEEIKSTLDISCVTTMSEEDYLHFLELCCKLITERLIEYYYPPSSMKSNDQFTISTCIDDYLSGLPVRVVNRKHIVKSEKIRDFSDQS